MAIAYTLIACLLVVCFGSVIYFLARHLNALRGDAFAQANLTSQALVPAADRYRPMLRLLADADFITLAQSGWSAKRIRQAKSERRKLFRSYLRCLVKDYARMFAGIRHWMVLSHVDRPDLANALTRNYALFTIGLLRIEVFLALHTLGLNRVDVSSLIGVVDTLRAQAGAFALVSAEPLVIR